MTHSRERLAAALRRDRTIDIVTTGARTGRRRATEIWFTNIGGRIIICGTPSPRDWLANLNKTPEFEFVFKESLQASLPAQAREVQDPDDRWAIMAAPETRWYRDQGYSVRELAARAPIVQVTFLPPYQQLNATHR